jgi:hypothetical protein
MKLTDDAPIELIALNAMNMPTLVESAQPTLPTMDIKKDSI